MSNFKFYFLIILTIIIVISPMIVEPIIENIVDNNMDNVFEFMQNEPILFFAILILVIILLFIFYVKHKLKQGNIDVEFVCVILGLVIFLAIILSQFRFIV